MTADRAQAMVDPVLPVLILAIAVGGLVVLPDVVESVGGPWWLSWVATGLLLATVLVVALWAAAERGDDR